LFFSSPFAEEAKSTDTADWSKKITYRPEVTELSDHHRKRKPKPNKDERVDQKNYQINKMLLSFGDEDEENEDGG